MYRRNKRVLIVAEKNGQIVQGPVIFIHFLVLSSKKRDQKISHPCWITCHTDGQDKFNETTLISMKRATPFERNWPGVTGERFVPNGTQNAARRASLLGHNAMTSDRVNSTHLTSSVQLEDEASRIDI